MKEGMKTCTLKDQRRCPLGEYAAFLSALGGGQWRPDGRELAPSGAGTFLEIALGGGR